MSCYVHRVHQGTAGPAAAAPSKPNQRLWGCHLGQIWGAHRPNYIHGQFEGIFFCPPGTPGPPVHPRGNFYQIPIAKY
jgi:hypothetical protein